MQAIDPTVGALIIVFRGIEATAAFNPLTISVASGVSPPAGCEVAGGRAAGCLNKEEVKECHRSETAFACS